MDPTKGGDSLGVLDVEDVIPPPVSQPPRTLTREETQTGRVDDLLLPVLLTLGPPRHVHTSGGLPRPPTTTAPTPRSLQKSFPGNVRVFRLTRSVSDGRVGVGYWCRRGKRPVESEVPLSGVNEG